MLNYVQKALTILTFVLTFLCGIFITIKKYCQMQSLTENLSQNLFLKSGKLKIIEKLFFLYPTTMIQSMSDEHNCLISILTCLICQKKASQAHICPNCSKFFCLECIKTWISDKNSQCPYCKQALDEKQLINCQKLSVQLSNAFETMNVTKAKIEKKCSRHHLQLSYYCKDCHISVCSDCCVLSQEHLKHSFQKKYEGKKHFDKEISQLKQKVALVKQKSQKEYKFNVSNKNILEDIIELDLKKLTSFIKIIRDKNTKKFSAENKQIQKTLQDQNHWVKQKNHIYEESLQFIKECPKIQFVSTKAQQLQAQLKIHIEETKRSNLALEQKLNKLEQKTFQSQIQPQFHAKTFSLHNYSNLCLQNQMTYSEILRAQGLQWRLKIYPSGSKNQQIPCKQSISSKIIEQSYMSIFIEMKDGLRDQGKYRHKVIIENPKNADKNIMRQFESVFQKGQCWGYDKFAKISYLYDKGFISEQSDELKITLMIGPGNYFEAYQDSKELLNLRTKHMQGLKDRIRSMQGLL